MTHSAEKPGVLNDDTCLPTFGARLKSWRKRFWLSASAQRLMESLTCYSFELKYLIQLAEENKVENKSWAASARDLFEEAKRALKEGDEDRGWHCFLAAQRMELAVCKR
jgi:hypothetical protein